MSRSRLKPSNAERTGSGSGSELESGVGRGYCAGTSAMRPKVRKASVKMPKRGETPFVHGRHRIEPAHGHLGQAVAVLVVERERVLPVQARVRKRLRRSVDLQEKPLAVVMIGGLVTSTLFALLVLPPFYLRVHEWL